MYCDPKDSEKRKSTLILLNIILESLLKWFAPILSFTTEEIYQIILKRNKSIHLENFLNYPEFFKNDILNEKWIKLLKIRDVCNLSIEDKRTKKEIGSSLEASLIIQLDEKNLKIIDNIDLSELCITSSAIIKDGKYDEVSVETIKAEGEKCPVCWKVSTLPCLRHKN